MNYSSFFMDYQTLIDSLQGDGTYSLTAAIALLGISVVILTLVLFCFIIGLYCVSASSYYTMAKNQNIRFPGLVWVPFVRYFTFGKIIGDRFVINGHSIKQAKWIMLGVTVIPTVIIFIMNFKSSALAYVFTIPQTVVNLFFFYRLYKLYKPGKEGLYTVLSFFFSFLVPVFVFSMKDNEPKEYADDFPDQLTPPSDNFYSTKNDGGYSTLRDPEDHNPFGM